MKIRLVGQFFDSCSYGGLVRAYAQKLIEQGHEVLFDIIICDNPIKVKTENKKFVLRDPSLTFLQPTIDLINESRFRVFNEPVYTYHCGHLSFKNIHRTQEEPRFFFKGNRFNMGDYDEEWFFTTWHYLTMIADPYVQTHFRTVFEGLGCQKMYVLAMRQFADTVHVPSSVCQRVLGQYDIDTKLLPDTYLFEYPTHDEPTHLDDLKKIWPVSSGKTWLFIGDWLPRKGIKDSLRFFKAHMGENDRMFIKTHISARRFYPNDREDQVVVLETRDQKDSFLAYELMDMGVDSRVVVLAGVDLNNADIDWLHEQADGYIALYRAEGFLLPAYKSAVLLNKPIITTEGGASDDFLKPGGVTLPHATLIPSEEIEFDKDDSLSINDTWLQKAVDPYFFYGDAKGNPARWLKPVL